MMNAISTSLKRFPVASFAAVTVLLSFGVDFLPIPRSGLPFALVLIPAVVAMAVAGATEGKPAVRSLLAQLTGRRASLKWVAIALALALAMRLAISLVASFGGLIPTLQLRPANPAQVAVLALIYLVAALSEELGWRGFALSRLLTYRSPVLASIVLGLPWGLIHIILHLPGMWAEGLPWLPTVVPLLSLSVAISWLFVSSGYSLLVASLFHAAQSAFGFVNEGLSPLQIHGLMTLVWSAVAVLALVRMLTSTELRQRALAAV